ncbi:MAG: GreA/GreB family elongation factor [Chlamydiota bacterium]
MTYLADFIKRIEKNDYPGFLQLWEEYCYSDEFDIEEYRRILQEARNSPLVVPFGSHVEKGLILWKKIEKAQDAHDILKLIFQIQTSHSESLYTVALEFLQKKYPEDTNFGEKIRMIGLRLGENFQGAIGNYELLTHMSKGNFVYHSGGWGASEILEVSMIREELALECEHVLGTKHLSFANAFKTLIPIEKEHFLARRFGNPDLLEQQARENPTEVLRSLLRDLGPKTAAEIKDELFELVIPEKDWNRWWQNTRSKLKKDTRIACPKHLRLPFTLLEEAIPHEVAFYKALEEKPDVPKTIQMVYGFLRDFSETLKNQDFKSSLIQKITDLLQQEGLHQGEILSLLFFLEDLKVEGKRQEAEDLIVSLEDPLAFLGSVEVISFKKRTLVLMRAVREDWQELFFSFLFAVEQNTIRDYLLQELHETAEIEEKIAELLKHPLLYPEVFVWYFQKILDKKSSLPYASPTGRPLFFEAFLILFDHLSKKAEHKDLGKKMLQILLQGRYRVIRDVMRESSLAQVREFLLLSTKCELFSDHDIKIIYSLAEVVYPELSKSRKKVEEAESYIWTTEEGLQKVRDKIKQIATVDTVENAKEIEEARAHGDLRENSEFKFALEKRARLQAELRTLSEAIEQARVITPADIAQDYVGIGAVVDCENGDNRRSTFTILGPWDADPERNVLSFQSKLAQTLEGLRIGDSFPLQEEELRVVAIRSFFDGA